MTDFTQHTLDTAPAASKPVLQATAQTYGFVPNLHATLAESPVALQGLDRLFELIGSGGLTPQEQQTVMLAVSVFNECGYCVAGHSFVARSMWVGDAVVQALRRGTEITDSPRLQALRTFTEAVLRERGHVGAEVLAGFAAAGYSPQHALEVITIVAAKTLSNYANNLAQTPLDPFMQDPALHWASPTRKAAP